MLSQKQQSGEIYDPPCMRLGAYRQNKEVSKNIQAILELVNPGEDGIVKNKQNLKNLSSIVPYAKQMKNFSSYEVPS